MDQKSFADYSLPSYLDIYITYADMHGIQQMYVSYLHNVAYLPSPHASKQPIRQMGLMAPGRATIPRKSTHLGLRGSHPLG